jgi:Ca2+ transporting ATPase
MLWVNLIMDTLASLALATEPPSEELLLRKPYSRYESLITANMWRNIILQGLWQIAILGTILFKGTFLFNLRSRNIRRPIINPRRGVERLNR